MFLINNVLIVKVFEKGWRAEHKDDGGWDQESEKAPTVTRRGSDQP